MSPRIGRRRILHTLASSGFLFLCAVSHPTLSVPVPVDFPITTSICLGPDRAGEPYLRPEELHEGAPKACRNQTTSLEGSVASRAYAFVDASVLRLGSWYDSSLLRTQYVASGRCRATAPMALK